MKILSFIIMDFILIKYNLNHMSFDNDKWKKYAAYLGFGVTVGALLL